MNNEAIAESVISVYNGHNSELGPLDEDRVNDEMCVAWNCPEIGQVDDTLKKTLDLHFADHRLGVYFQSIGPLGRCFL